MRPGHSQTKLTYADYVLFPNDGLRHEIIDGEHYVTPAPSIRHQRISRNVFHFIQTHLDTHAIGELFFALVDALLSEHDIVVPDLLYISNERSRFLTSKNLQGPPDLVVEIPSPSTRRRDERLKRDLYERAGVQEYWLVDPERDVIEVYQRRADRFRGPVQYRKTDVLTSPLMPGLELSVGRILRGPAEPSG